MLDSLIKCQHGANVLDELKGSLSHRQVRAGELRKFPRSMNVRILKIMLLCSYVPLNVPNNSQQLVGEVRRDLLRNDERNIGMSG